MRGEGLTIVHQPIFDLGRGELVAVEALSRFAAEPLQPPDVWFAHAWAAGVGRDLEMAAAELALADLAEPFHGSGLVRARLDELRARGVTCALDDMGTGYAGLATLLALRPEVHKIDQSIVRGIRDDRARRALVAGWVAYAEQAGAEVIAEGIETTEELETLRILNVRLGQGFHLARPAPIDQLQLTPSA